MIFKRLFRKLRGRRSFFLVCCHHFLDFCNGLPWVEPLGACLCAVHNSVAAIEGEWVLQLRQTLLSEIVTRIDHPAIGLHKHRWSQVFIPIPPVAGAARAAAGTEDALVQAIQFLSVLNGLVVLHLALLAFILLLKKGLNGFVLGIKVTHILENSISMSEILAIVRGAGKGG